MTNKFILVGKVSVLSKDNPDYPGFYITPLYEEEKVIPINLRINKVLDYDNINMLEQLQNGMVIGVNGKIDANIFGIKLRAEKITIISKN